MFKYIKLGLYHCYLTSYKVRIKKKNKIKIRYEHKKLINIQTEGLIFKYVDIKCIHTE